MAKTLKGPARVPDHYLQPLPGSAYSQVLRTPGYSPLRSLIGAVLGVALFIMLTGVVTQGVIGIGWLIESRPSSFQTYYASAIAFEKPIGMLGANLGIACLIPISWLLVSQLHRVRPRWLSSIGPRLRWRYLVICLLIALVALNGVFVLSAVLGPAVTVRAQPGLWGFVVVIIVTSPIQAAAEEYFFRGYLMQAFGSLLGNPWFGVAASAVVFALFHGGQNLPLFIDRLAFGLLAGALVLRTGGLEAGIAAHVINNIFAYGIAGFTSTIAATRALTGIGWADAAFDVGGFAVFACLAWLAAKLLKLRTTST